MEKTLIGKVALVTGAGSGIGRTTAQLFAERGVKVVVVDCMAPEGEETVKIIRDNGQEAFFIKTDVTKSEDVEAMINKTIKKYGRLDCAFNNAGIVGARIPVHEYSEEMWDSVMAINLKGVMLCMKFEILPMMRQGYGVITNSSSVLGLAGTMHGSPAYSASKHAVIGLTKSAALDYAEMGIRINAICPGFIQTPLIDKLISSDPELKQRMLSKQPSGRLGTPEEVAETVLWLSSDSASFVTGSAMTVDGGYLSQ